MQVLFMSRHPDGARLRDFAERRLRFVLRRLAWLVVRAKVRLADVNGGRGGIDKRCHIELKTDGMPVVVATSVGADWRAAINAALSRAARLLVRRLAPRQRPIRSTRTSTRSPAGRACRVAAAAVTTTEYRKKSWLHGIFD